MTLGTDGTHRGGGRSCARGEGEVGPCAPPMPRGAGRRPVVGRSAWPGGGGGGSVEPESRRAAAAGAGPYTHTGLRAAPVSFLRVHWVLKRWRGATMSGGDGDRGAYPPPGTPGYARKPRSPAGTAIVRVPSVPSVPRGHARPLNPQQSHIRRFTGISLHQKDLCRLTRGWVEPHPPERGHAREAPAVLGRIRPSHAPS